MIPTDRSHDKTDSRRGLPKTSLLVILRSLLPDFPCIDQGSQPLNKEEKSSEEALGSQPGAALTPSRSPSFPGCQRGRRLITEAGVCMRRGRHSRFPGVCLPSEAREFLTPGRDRARGMAATPGIAVDTPTPKLLCRCSGTTAQLVASPLSRSTSPAPLSPELPVGRAVWSRHRLLGTCVT